MTPIPAAPPPKAAPPKQEPVKDERADFVSLRRYGDIINLLPLFAYKAKYEFQRPIKLVVAKEFVDLLDGVSYVEPVAWDGDWEDPLGAAKKHRAINLQVFGKGLRPNLFTENFARLAWRKLATRFQ